MWLGCKKCSKRRKCGEEVQYMSYNRGHRSIVGKIYLRGHV